jgi:single-strand DNA-binding protein
LFFIFVYHSSILAQERNAVMYQQITVLGNLGQDPEMRLTPQGISVTNFSVAVNEKYGDKETTVWFRVTCWRQLAAPRGPPTSQYLTKGRLVLITGRIQARAYKDRNGEPAVSLDLTAAPRGPPVKFLGSASREPAEGEVAVHTPARAALEDTTPDEIPF